MEGIILKGVGGLYEVQSGDAIHYCSARGKFRKREVSPLPGDRVHLAPLEQSGQLKTGKKDAIQADAVITEILPRKNQFIRPKLANLTHLFLISAAAFPQPSLIVIDKLTAVCVHKGVTPVLIFSKSDLGSVSEYVSIYTHAGFPVFTISNETGEGIAEVTEYLHTIAEQAAEAGEPCNVAFAGNSGVGKSSLLNRIFPELQLETGEISQKLGRGRHTTRTAQLYPLWETGGYVVDTPGFGAMDTERYALIRKEELADCFPEFAPYREDCFFTGCSHTVEKGCQVLQALQEGKIEPTRHASYCEMYKEAKEIKEWELK
jgi:ribosome biogenesis GTPase